MWSFHGRNAKIPGFSICLDPGINRSQDSEETGFRHLYYVKVGLNMGNQIPESKGFGVEEFTEVEFPIAHEIVFLEEWGK